MEVFTTKEIAQKLSIPKSTVRYYRDKFEEFIPSVSKGRRKRYKSEAFAIIQYIADMSKENKTVEYIVEQLKTRFPMCIDVIDEAQHNTTITQQQSNKELLVRLDAVEKLTAIVAQLHEEKTNLKGNFFKNLFRRQ